MLLYFGTATPIIRPIISRSPSPPSTTGRLLPAVPKPSLTLTSGKYATTTPISTDLVFKHSISAADKNCDNIVHLDAALKASDVLTLANCSRPSPVLMSTNISRYTPQIITSSTFDGKTMLVVIDEGDIYRYIANETCMHLIIRMLNKDMLHHL